MRFRLSLALVTMLLVAAACSDSESGQTTTTNPPSTTTTLVPTTTTEAGSTTTSDATTTTAVTSTSTTLAAEDSTTTTTRVPLTTTTTEPPPEDADPNLAPWAGLFRQPTVWDGFLQFEATGVIRAGTDPNNLTITGRWDYDDDTDEFLFSDFDFGPAGCDGAEGRYERETAFGGGRRIILVEDPCEARVDFITQPGSTCQCFVYNEVEFVDEDE